MYLDAVLDRQMRPMYNSTPDNVKQWLEEHKDIRAGYDVCIGKTMKVVTVEEYLQR